MIYLSLFTLTIVLEIELRAHCKLALAEGPSSLKYMKLKQDEGNEIKRRWDSKFILSRSSCFNVPGGVHSDKKLP